MKTKNVKISNSKESLYYLKSYFRIYSKIILINKKKLYKIIISYLNLLNIIRKILKFKI